MPHYHFHLHNSVGSVEDEEGRDLPDLAAAREEGLGDIRSIIAEDVRHGRLDLCGRLEVVDGTGRLLLTLAFVDALDMSDEPESPEAPRPMCPEG
jgi:uncharacterized protein DUF6894